MDQLDPLLDKIMSAHWDVTICMDIMHVYKVTLLVTVSKHIGFGTVEYIPNCQGATIAQAVWWVAAMYR